MMKVLSVRKLLGPTVGFAVIFLVLILSACGGGGGGNGDGEEAATLSIAGVSITEGDSGTRNADLVVTLSRSLTQTVTVDYATSDGTATTADNDYSAASGTLTFSPSTTSQVISVTVQGDTQVESDETFTLTLSNPVNSTLADASATATIENDDTAPTIPDINIAGASVTEGDSGTVNVNLTVTLSSATSQTVTVDYATSDGTATTADNDYTAASASLTFTPTTTSQTISIIVHGDTTQESDETFSVVLSNPVNATLATATAVATISDDDTPVFGLDARPSNTTCLAVDRPQTGTTIQLQQQFASLGFNQPTTLLQAPGDDTRWFVTERPGRVYTFANDTNVTEESLFIDISSTVNSGPGEAGLLGMAFDRDFSSNGHVYLSYTVGSLTSRIARYTSLDGGLTLDAASEQVIIDIPQFSDNHNGGYIAFGPGPSTGKYLYIGLGDGGGGGDPGEHAENTQTLLGAMLRIDVDVSEVDWNGGTRYYIPSDNPFSANANCGDGGCPEIYAWGFRNPWRWSFDRDTEELWLGDVGQNAWEEVNRVELGGNYGWDIREGAHCYEPSSGCDTTGLIDPVAEYGHQNGNRSVTGGYVYRGSEIPSLQGTYLYGDFYTGRIWGLDAGQLSPTPEELLVAAGEFIASFAEDNNGEVYILAYSGRIHKIVVASAPVDTFPDLLSETGCVDDLDATQVASGLIPYEINAPFWSDGVAKERYLSLPNNTTISIDNEDDWIFPIGSVLLKNFRIAGNLIETRLLMRHDDGIWGGYSYEWNNAQTDANLVLSGKTKMIGSQNWLYPSSSQCIQCHTDVGGGPLGPETAQMNRDFTFPSTSRTANQLASYEHVNLFAAPLSDVPENLPALVAPDDTSASLHDRARAYLHTNCAQCHQPGGPTPVNMDLRYFTANAAMNICDVVPQNGDLGISNVRLVSPGQPSQSMVLERMNRRDVHGMPPVGSFMVDSDGVALISAWITAMGVSCP